MNTLAVIAALLLGTTPAGSLVTVQSSCSYTLDGATQTSPIASSTLGVLSPVCAAHPSPVFFENYFHKYKNADGTVVSVPQHIADGMLVRFLKRSANGDYTVLEGLQMSDGQVLVNGTPVQRDE